MRTGEIKFNQKSLPNGIGSDLGLKKLRLKSEYNTDDDNIIRDLYQPCLELSTKYDRAVGYFRANVYRELGKDLLNFVVRGGKVRIVTSPDIPEEEESAAREGYELRNISKESEESDLIKIMKIMSQNPKEKDCLDMLRLLIEKSALDLFVAVRKGGIYHRKIGIFYDEFENKVVFSGSGNETSRAIGSIEDWGNDEDFDVYLSWGSDFESKKVEVKESHLNVLFSGGSKRTKVRPINEVERAYLEKFRSHKTYADCEKGAKERTEKFSGHNNDRKVSLYFYQEEAVNAWKTSGNVGMLSMPTGTGKTYTALFAVEELLLKGNPILILVPSKILLEQWKETISEIHMEVPVLMAGGGHSWKTKKNKRLFISDIDLPRIILATMDTAVTNDFLEFFKQAKKPVLVADEAHRLGSAHRRKILEINFPARLGLSATPERLFDSEGSEVLEQVFGENPIFKLDIGQSVKLEKNSVKEVPILGHFLSTYDYYYYTTELTEREQKQYNELTKEIQKTAAIIQSRERESELVSNARLNLLLIERAKIIKKAENKIQIVSKIVADRYPKSGKWIVYCEDEKQLKLVVKHLKENRTGNVIMKYHSKMTPEEREKSLNYFKNNPSIIVSIKCLDEGVDIPDADGAIILASSSNPRQYIQRRGRVLRKTKGKKSATIIDVIVLPKNKSNDNTFSITKSELGRAWNFANNARNRDMTHQLWRTCMEFGVNFERDSYLGFEE